MGGRGFEGQGQSRRLVDLDDGRIGNDLDGDHGVAHVDSVAPIDAIQLPAILEVTS